MSTSRLWIVGVLGLLFLFGLVNWLGEEGASTANQKVAVPLKPAPVQLPLGDPVPVQPSGADVAVAVVDESVPAAVSMANARENGDSRMPPVVRSEPLEAPTSSELADPDSYQRYEQRQEIRLQKAYVKAADEEVPRLQQDIERGRAMGVAPEELAQAEEKLRRIRDMRDQLVTRNPDIGR